MYRARTFSLVVLCVLWCAATHGQEQGATEMNKPGDGSYEVAEIYSDLRSRALAHRSEQTAENKGAVLAVLMETGYPKAVATLVSIDDGAVSIYFSNGGGIIGAGEHEPVRKSSQQFLELAQRFVAKATLVDSFPLPEPTRVRFYLVTSAGTYTIDALEDDLGYDRHEFSPLFHQGHELIGAVREHSE